MASYKLDWKGGELKEQVIAALAAGLTEFGLRVESAAKRDLQPGWGVLTGTLRRSIHSAGPSYNWTADDVTPGPGTPERGGTGEGAERVGNQLVIQTGSGMSYAGVIEDLYGYMDFGLETALPELLPTLQKHAGEAGLQ